MARAIAILAMLQGHALHAVLATELRSGTVFEVWSFAHGFTSCLFLVVSGWAFTIATRRHWEDHVYSAVTIGRRLRRFCLFLMLGYALHFPVAKITHLYGVNVDGLRGFLVVDVLQCLAVTLAVLQSLVLVTRTPGRYATAAAIGCVAVVLVTPAMWRIDWPSGWSRVLTAYLASANGSPFPLFPWAAYVLLGAVVGDVYVSWGARHVRSFANWVCGTGTAFLIVCAIGARLPWSPFGQTEFWYSSPNHFLLRAGAVLIVLALLAHLSLRRTAPLPHIVRVIAGESLVIYVIHLCIVYGSAWNVGLRQTVGPTLSLIPAIGCVGALCGAMILAAWTWSWCKQQAGLAQWVRVGTIGLIAGKQL